MPHSHFSLRSLAGCVQWGGDVILPREHGLEFPLMATPWGTQPTHPEAQNTALGTGSATPCFSHMPPSPVSRTLRVSRVGAFWWLRHLTSTTLTLSVPTRTYPRAKGEHYPGVL